MSRAPAVPHEPVVLETDEGRVIGMITAPRGEDRSVGAVFFPPGGYTISSQRNEWAARMADRLADDGFTVARFDYRGIGDSTSDVDRFDHTRPFLGEGRAAVAELRSRGCARILLIGQCFGARTALALAPEVESLAGVFGISPPVRDAERGEGTASRMAHDASVGAYFKKAASSFEVSALRSGEARRRYRRMAALFVKARWTSVLRKLGVVEPDPVPWVSRPLISHVKVLADLHIPLMVVYGADEADSDDYADAKRGPLGALLSRATLREVEMEGRVHNMGRSDVQEAVIDTIIDFAAWAAEQGSPG